MLTGKASLTMRGLKHWRKFEACILPGNMILPPDFREFLQLLNKNDVRYLVIGGFAVAFHGYPRFTKDIDIWLWLDPENAKRIVKTLKDFGFGSLDLTDKDFLEPDLIIQLGYPPNRIDLLTTASGVDFKECYQARIEDLVDGVTLPFIDLQNLKKNKRSSGRAQDVADLENLE